LSEKFGEGIKNDEWPRDRSFSYEKHSVLCVRHDHLESDIFHFGVTPSFVCQIFMEDVEDSICIP
jgi:hypothetical protein